ncbi:hypothetical protein LTR37_013249 [Vermiconidia calcicola]|uniref:Uncharacterized protein n=1 Tax=Vermiconidia calcicola TaxID=1690605 RepID=A0ACC3MYA7_9PEZI|nr:hypothetical protein LTR37_013249 [Vermiconidia calcicola]
MSSAAGVDASSRRLYTVTPTDHTAYIVIATAVGLAILPVFGLIRYFVRRATDIGADDVLLFASSAVAIVQSDITLRAPSSGLGQSTTILQPERVAVTEQLYYTSIILWVLSLALSKASTASLLMRLGVTKQHKMAFGAMLAFVALWSVASVFALALQCDLSQPWRLAGTQCPGTTLRWEITSAFDILFEVAVPFAAAALVWPLEAAIATKLNVTLAFCFRLPLVIIIAIRLLNFPANTLTRDPTLRLDLFVVWSQTQMFWSIISAIIPSLRPFLRGLSTYTEDLGGSTTDPHSQRYAKPSEYELSNLRSTASNSNHHQSQSQSHWKGGGDSSKDFLDTIIGNTGQHSTSVGRAQRRADGNDQQSLDSNDSQNMIIQKDVQFTVAWESAQEKSY